MDQQKQSPTHSLIQSLIPSPIHLMGISGIGMKALLKIFLDLNYDISGSDIKVDQAVQSLISPKNYFSFQHPDHIKDDIKTVVYSSAISESNVELQAARAKGLICLSRAEALAKIASLSKACIAISGTHGKTTTTALTSFLLQSANYKPSYYIGGIPQNSFPQASFNHNHWFVTETDESDGSFLNIPATLHTILNIDNDHLSYYGHFDALLQAFQTYINQALQKKQGLIVNIDNQHLRSLCKKNTFPIYAVGLNPQADFHAKNITFGPRGLSMSIYIHGKHQGDIKSALYGQHNIENILMGMASALQAGVTFAEIKKAMPLFLGTKKRFERLSKHRQNHIILDYAHHPTAIQATLNAYQHHFNQSLTIVFQPHRFSRLHHFFDAFVDVLSRAENIYILPVFSAQESNTYNITSQHLVKALEKKQTQVHFLNHVQDLKTKTRTNNKALLFMGAGDIDEQARAYTDQNYSAEMLTA